jgi:pyruvate ferredoxin oxidoreductase gamma subunit
VFHDDLIAPLDLGRGLQRGAVCIVNTIRPADEIRHLLNLESGRIVCLDATRIAFESRSRLNMPLLAALCRELGFPLEQLTDVILRQWPRAAEANRAALSSALAGCVVRTYESPRNTVKTVSVSRGPIGWRNMLNGGAISALTHSTIQRDNRVAGRGRVPKFDPGVCNSCGICLTVCSDPGGLLWREGRMTGIDDKFCKGCMRCVEVCPDTKRGHALTFDYS